MKPSRARPDPQASRAPATRGWWVARGLKLAILLVGTLLLWAVVWRGARAATPLPPVAMPYYSGEQALTGVYAHHLPPLARRFQAEADALVTATQQHCEALPGLGADHTGYTALLAASDRLHAQWQQTMAAWEALSTPAIGPVLTRRSQRQIDFWPTRPELIAKALDKAPHTLADMERVGTLAKGLPAFESLLLVWRPLNPAQARAFDARGLKPGEKPRAVPFVNRPMPAATCQYLVLVAQGVQAEGQELAAELTGWAAKDWLAQSESDAQVTRAALVEWLNQWLGGVERLRWMHLEKPVKTVQTAGNALKGNPPHFARHGREANLAGWRAQWASLKAQGQLTAAQRQQPPVPGDALVPIEALLLGKGHIALAQRWAQALDAVSAQLDRLPATAPVRATDHRQLLALAAALKAVTVLYQTEVATALDIPLGFSDADGD